MGSEPLAYHHQPDHCCHRSCLLTILGWSRDWPLHRAGSGPSPLQAAAAGGCIFFILLRLLLLLLLLPLLLFLATKLRLRMKLRLVLLF